MGVADQNGLHTSSRTASAVDEACVFFRLGIGSQFENRGEMATIAASRFHQDAFQIRIFRDPK